MSKFKVGDMVRTSIKLAEKYGIVYGIGAEFWKDSKTRKVLAVYDDDPAQTDYKLSGTCFFWPEYALVSAEPREFIVIRRDKSDVIASHKRGNEIVKTAKATCAPSDEFNFETGAKLAFDRLMGREEPKRESLADLFARLENPAPAPEPKYYSGKVFAVRTKEDDATPQMQNRVGHVFEIKDGRIVGEHWNFDLGNMRPFNSFSEFCKYCSATEWAEVKE